MTDLIALLRPATRVLVFTGAGLSTSSGIPDFRGPQGIWKRRQPVYYDEFLSSEDKRIEYWSYKEEGFEGFQSAAPSASHRAIATLERMGRLQAVVTQNIDGLHQEGGVSPAKVIEVHGTNREVECVRCGRRSDPGPAVRAFRATKKVPVCSCGGWLKFATVSFGQALDPGVLRRATAEAESADLVLALGSTLSVYPAASIPIVAVKAGAPYIIINRGGTDHDSIATLRIDDAIDAVLPDAIEALSRED